MRVLHLGLLLAPHNLAPRVYSQLRARQHVVELQAEHHHCVSMPSWPAGLVVDRPSWPWPDRIWHLHVPPAVCLCLPRCALIQHTQLLRAHGYVQDGNGYGQQHLARVLRHRRHFSGDSCLLYVDALPGRRRLGPGEVLEYERGRQSTASTDSQSDLSANICKYNDGADGHACHGREFEQNNDRPL